MSFRIFRLTLFREQLRQNVTVAVLRPTLFWYILQAFKVGGGYRAHIFYVISALFIDHAGHVFSHGLQIHLSQITLHLIFVISYFLKKASVRQCLPQNDINCFFSHHSLTLFSQVILEFLPREGGLWQSQHFRCLPRSSLFPEGIFYYLLLLLIHHLMEVQVFIHIVTLLHTVHQITVGILV